MGIWGASLLCGRKGGGWGSGNAEIDVFDIFAKVYKNLPISPLFFLSSSLFFLSSFFLPFSYRHIPFRNSINASYSNACHLWTLRKLASSTSSKYPLSPFLSQISRTDLFTIRIVFLPSERCAPFPMERGRRYPVQTTILLPFGYFRAKGAAWRRWRHCLDCWRRQW